MSTSLFSESQRFRQRWLWILILATLVGTIIGALRTSIDKNGADIIWSLRIMLLVIIGFWVLGLDTRIDKDGIYYRFFPILIRERVIVWSDVTKIYVREYS